MHDLQADSDRTSHYECLDCGAIVSATTRPNQCEECGRLGTFQNRAQSLE